MKKLKLVLSVLAFVTLLTACSEDDVVDITLSDSGIEIENHGAVQITNDIIYYESGKDFTYGEGEEEDAHTKEEADAHTVVKIIKPGTYSVSGKLSKGQIAIDLGENAEDDKNAVVNLVLNGVDITCDVAPAVIFYNVYECGSDDEENATKDVNTSKAGANVVIANGTVNTVSGSYVARIYEPSSVELSDDGKKVEDADKLHKYDAAFYSKMSMNIGGGNGVLNINAENEGLDSEMHLTINSGNININSGNDGINTNEDNVSVTTINGGTVKIKVNGATGEGDGIDSNGWLVINGGEVYAEACSFSADAGIDSDCGIHINGGTVIATGNMSDFIEDGGQTYVAFNFAERQKGGVTSVILKDKVGEVFKATPTNDYSVLVYSAPDLKEGTYTFWSDDTQLAGAKAKMFGRPGMGEGDDRTERPVDFEPEKTKPKFDPEKLPDEGFDSGKNPREKRPEKPGEKDMMPNFSSHANIRIETSPDFAIEKGGNMFSAVTKMS